MREKREQQARLGNPGKLLAIHIPVVTEKCLHSA